MQQMVKEGRGLVTRGARAEGLRVARLLKEWIESAGYSINQVEHLAGWGQKTLWEVLQGSQPIRFSHVATVCEVCGFDLGEFYVTLGQGPAGGGGKKPKKRAAPPKPEPLEDPSDEELYAKFRRWLKQEGIGDKKKPGGGGGSRGEA